MDLEQALEAIKNSDAVMNAICNNGLVQEYQLIDKAVCVLIAEHGKEYVAL